MRRSLLVVMCLFSIGCQSEKPLTGDAQQAPDKQVAEPVDTKVAGIASSRADSNEAISLKLTAGDPKSKFAPRYSPPGKAIKLTASAVPAELGVDGLQGEVVLGAPAEKQTPLKMLVTRAAAGEVFSNLYIDMDRNGVFDEPTIAATVSNSRGMIWSNFAATLKVTHQAEEAVTEDYPVSFWLTVPAAADQPDVLRMSRRGHKVGEVTVGSEKVAVVLSDSNNDAVFGEGDWWELRREGSSEKPDMRRVGEFAWLGESAYKLEIVNTYGSSARLIPFDPGITREADALARDPYGADRKAVKAAKPLEFRHDVDDALAEASDKKQPCFIKFETTWCGPCKLMTELVFTAKDVVDASEGLVCIKVDGDDRKDLVERFQVTGYPTGVMISADGLEAARFVGYQKVPQMAAFLSKRSAAGP